MQPAYAENSDSNGQNIKTVYLNDHTFYNEIPNDFDPINASDEDLRLYGLPQRPSNPVDLKQWEKQVSGATWEKPTIQELPKNIRLGGSLQLTGTDNMKDSATESTTYSKTEDITYATANQNWCGYIYTSSAYGAKTEITVPTIYASSSYRPAACAQWAGIGGYSSGKLAQLGIGENVSSSGTSSYFAWYETIGTDVDDSAYQLTNFSVSPGDDIFVSMYIDFSVSSGINLIYYYHNYTTSKYTSVTVNVTSYSGIATSAEWIFERPSTSSGYAYLARPTVNSAYQVPFTSCGYRNSSSVWKSASGSQYYIYNPSTGNTLATASSMSSNAFTATWKNYN